MNSKLDWKYINDWSKRIRAINYLGGKCVKCFDRDIFNLSFHHVNDKKFDINDLRGYRWSKILNEVEKCELLCNNCHHEIHYLKNVVDYGLRRNKAIYLEYRGQKCEKCNYNKNSSSLIFHHIEKSTKLFNINKHRIRYIKELDDYIKCELDKCIVLCQNCHVKQHIDVDKFNRLRVEIYEKVDNFKEIIGKISRNDVKVMYENGFSQKEIAKHFNSSTGTISDIIKELGINREYKIDKDKVYELYKNGFVPIEIAKKLNINKNSIYKVINKIKNK